MPEGRVLNNAGTLTQEFVIADQQGNAGLSFQDKGNGTPVVKQENSYYAFGMVMANSPVAQPTVPNKQLYNGGSEWQNDYSNQPDYYQTFYRNYDAALGRFIGVDPMAVSKHSMTPYQYAGDNSVMYNDPLGDLEALPNPDEGDTINGGVLDRGVTIYGGDSDSHNEDSGGGGLAGLSEYLDKIYKW